MRLGAVRRLREAGAVFVGKTNTPEFGQSATTENLLGDGCRNPWNPSRTAGGSSGGGAVSVAVGMASLALASDGGGSIRIPAAFCGLFGIKPTFGLVEDEDGFLGMTDFACPGPVARRVADARIFLAVLARARFARRHIEKTLRVAWCPRPEGRPVDRRVSALTLAAAETLASLGHEMEEVELPVDGWQEIFRILVLADEWRFRGELYATAADRLTDYERKTLEAAEPLAPAQIAEARQALGEYRARFADFFEAYDLIVTPTTATVTFPLGRRPRTIAGEAVDRLWGAFPFTPMFNVAGCPAASVPCGLVEGLPAGIQLIAPAGDRKSVV